VTDRERDEDPPRKRIRIQRRRLGKIMFFDPVKNYGFIDGEDFREDVYFHLYDWEGAASPGPLARTGNRKQNEGERPSSEATQPEVGLWVEFEINDEFFEEEQRLRAKVVRPTKRPSGRKLSGRDATFNIVTHHKNARRKRPSWRK